MAGARKLLDRGMGCVWTSCLVGGSVTLCWCVTLSGRSEGVDELYGTEPDALVLPSADMALPPLCGSKLCQRSAAVKS
jgi:hypothetical protein